MGDPFFSTTTGLGKDFGVVLPSRGVVDDSTKSLESAIGVFQRLKEQGVTDPLTHMKEVEGYDIAGKSWFSEGVGYALTKLERENQQKLGHLDIFFDRKYDGVKLKPERESDMYYETRTTEQIFESTTNTTVKGLEQYDTHYLKNSIRAKEIWDTIGTEKMNELGFKMNSVGHIVLKADPTQKEGVIAKKIEKLLDTHRHATHQERDAPRAYLANISSDAGDDFVRESYSYELTELQTRYLKKHNLIASLDELRKFDDPDMKGQRRVLTDYFGTPRGEMIGTPTGGPNTFSFIPTSAG